MEKEDDQQSGNRKLQPPTISQHTKTFFPEYISFETQASISV
jgi:hypothetical protein